MENLTLLNNTSPNFSRALFHSFCAACHLPITRVSLSHLPKYFFFHFFCRHHDILQVLIMERMMQRKMILSHFFYKGRREWKCEWHCFLDSELDVAFSLIRHTLTGSYWQFFTFSIVTCSMLVFTDYDHDNYTWLWPYSTVTYTNDVDVILLTRRRMW